MITISFIDAPSTGTVKKTLQMHLVSVLIPCYNAERYIGETLESVLSQTWQETEIIIVNDGSTDNSASEIERFRSPKLAVTHQGNLGQTAALNRALSQAAGDFVQYLDADDLISKDKIERQMSRLLEAPDCVASAEWGRFYRFPDETQFVPEEVWRDLDPVDWLALSRQDGLGMMFPALWLIPRSLIERCGRWREDLTLNNDAEYFTRLLLLARRVLFCEGARCYYRSGVPGSLSGRRSQSAWQSQFKVLMLCQDYVLAHENSERLRRCFALSWQHFAHSVYPYDRLLAEKALSCAKDLHGVQIKPDGGPGFKVASRIMGWKAARLLQVATGRS